MTAWKTLITLSILLLGNPLMLSGSPCRAPVQGPPGPEGPQGPQGQDGANQRAVNGWAQSDFIGDADNAFVVGDSIPFNAIPNELNGPTYTAPDFTLPTSGNYQVVFEGYVLGMDNNGNTGVQFFLNGSPIGTAYAPVPATLLGDVPFTLVTQAIFSASAGDVLSVRVIGNDGDTLFFDTNGGGASADVKIIKLS